MASDFTTFHAGCHGPVPLQTANCSEDAFTHSMISPVHHVPSDHGSLVRALGGREHSRRRPSRPIFGGRSTGDHWVMSPFQINTRANEPQTVRRKLALVA